MMGVDAATVCPDWRGGTAACGRRGVLAPRQVPEVVNDGVTIARDIELDDPKANTGAKLLVEVASKTDQKAGDGTTTSTVLTQATAAAAQTVAVTRSTAISP